MTSHATSHVIDSLEVSDHKRFDLEIIDSDDLPIAVFLSDWTIYMVEGEGMNCNRKLKTFPMNEEGLKDLYSDLGISCLEDQDILKNYPNYSAMVETIKTMIA